MTGFSRLFTKFLMLSFLLTTGSLVAHAAGTDADHYYKFDKVHTQIIFFVDHLGFSKSEGEFLDFDGGFVFDPENPEDAKVHVIINANSVTMDDQKWTDHVKNADFFDVPTFPEIEFKSHSVSVLGDNFAEVTGDLTLLGVTKPVTLEVTYNKSGVHPYSKKFVAGFSATASLKRSDFDMVYGLPGIGNEVEIRIEVEGIKQ